jgi:hypothetical protein
MPTLDMDNFTINKLGRGQTAQADHNRHISHNNIIHLFYVPDSPAELHDKIMNCGGRCLEEQLLLKAFPGYTRDFLLNIKQKH